jgi:hypothetical protein
MHRYELQYTWAQSGAADNQLEKRIECTKTQTGGKSENRDRNRARENETSAGLALWRGKGKSLRADKILALKELCLLVTSEKTKSWARDGFAGQTKSKA